MGTVHRLEVNAIFSEHLLALLAKTRCVALPLFDKRLTLCFKRIRLVRVRYGLCDLLYGAFNGVANLVDVLDNVLPFNETSGKWCKY